MKTDSSLTRPERSRRITHSSHEALAKRHHSSLRKMRHAFSLVEVLLSLFFVIALVGILVGTTGSMLTRRQSDLSNIATKVTTKEVERLRGLDYTSLLAEGNLACTGTYAPFQDDLDKLRSGQICRIVTSFEDPENPGVFPDDVRWVTVDVKWKNDNGTQLSFALDTLVYENGI